MVVWMKGKTPGSYSILFVIRGFAHGAQVGLASGQTIDGNMETINEIADCNADELS